MSNKDLKNEAVFNKKEFLGILSTISMIEVLKLKYRGGNKQQWEQMVTMDDVWKNKFVCNICKACQYGEKNLFSHLAGKKHVNQMDKVKQVFFPSINKGHTVPTPKMTEPVGAKDSLVNPKTSVVKPVITNNELPTITKITIVEDKRLKNNLLKIKEGCKVSSECSALSEPLLPTTLDIQRLIMSDKYDSSKKITFENITHHKRCSEKIQSESNLNLSSSENKTGSNLSYKNRQQSKMANLKTQPNIVRNPLNINNIKIACVPLSKLLTQTVPEEKTPEKSKLFSTMVPDLSKKKMPDQKHDDVIVIEEENLLEDMSLNSKEIISHSTSRSEESQKMSFVSPKHFPNSFHVSGATFESISNKNDIMGLLGVEYVIKIVKGIKDSCPKFLCSFCNITSDEISMHNHLLSYNHRLNYCEKHFPTALRHFKQYITNVPEHQTYRVMAPILEKLARAIEKHHGRETAYLCYDYSFNKRRQHIVSKVFQRRHASERHGPNFTHVIDLSDINLMIKTASRSTPNIVTRNNAIFNPTFNTFNNCNNMYIENEFLANYPAYSHAITEENIALDDETHKRLVDNFLRVTRKSQPIRYKRESTAVSRNRSISLSPARKRRRSSTLFSSQWDMERRSISPLRDGDIWQAYRHMVDHRVRELNNIFNLYKSDPEEHPLYKENWEKFWKRRKDELITAGINHRTYNYQNEWILFFNIRLEELYNQEVENIKQKCRENLCLSMTNNNLGDPKYHVKISESDSDDIEPADEQVKNVEMQEKTKKDFKKIKVIHVLRLLTALEDHLGSLGAGVTELLSKALQTYKLGSDNADSILLNPQSCAILETAKEKFTGLILSKILDAAQERAVKQAINETRQLLKYAEQLNKDIQVNDESFESMCKYDASTTQKNEAFIEKTELATKLASSLISQGKSKINQDQLHQIVQVYSLFKQKKRLETPSARKSLSNLPPYQAFQNFNKSDQCRQSPYFQYDLSNNKRMSSTITNGSSMNTIVNDISANTSLSPIDSSNPSRHDKEYLRNGYNSSKQYGYQPPAYGESPMNITGPNNYRDIDYSGMNTNRTDRNPTWM